MADGTAGFMSLLRKMMGFISIMLRDRNDEKIASHLPLKEVGESERESTHTCMDLPTLLAAKLKTLLSYHMPC